MTELKILPDDLQIAAKEFEQAYQESQATLLRLEKAVAALEAKWDGASRQFFYKHFQDWKTTMGGMSVLLKRVSRELTAMADEFQKADKRQ